jgi:hypothetical protein
MRGDGSAGRSSESDIWASPGLRDVQLLADHASLADTQCYIDQNHRSQAAGRGGVRFDQRGATYRKQLC